MALFDYLDATKENPDTGPECAALFERYLADLESIAADPALPAEERDIARETLDDFRPRQSRSYGSHTVLHA